MLVFISESPTIYELVYAYFCCFADHSKHPPPHRQHAQLWRHTLVLVDWDDGTLRRLAVVVRLKSRPAARSIVVEVALLRQALWRHARFAVVVVAFLCLTVLSIQRRANVVKRRSAVGGFRPRRQHNVVVAESKEHALLIILVFKVTPWCYSSTYLTYHIYCMCWQWTFG